MKGDEISQFLTWLGKIISSLATAVVSGNRTPQQLQALKDQIQGFITDKDYGYSQDATLMYVGQAICSGPVSSLDLFACFADPDEKMDMVLIGGWGYLLRGCVGAVGDVPEINVRQYAVLKDCGDPTIFSSLPSGYCFDDPGLFCAYLASMLAAQAEGQEGILLSNGLTNFFYVKNLEGDIVVVRAAYATQPNQWHLAVTPLSPGEIPGELVHRSGARLICPGSKAD